MNPPDLTLGEKKPCCRIDANLEVVNQPRPDLLVRRCRVCNCRHFELTVDPVKIGLAGNKIGLAGSGAK